MPAVPKTRNHEIESGPARRQWMSRQYICSWAFSWARSLIFAMLLPYSDSGRLKSFVKLVKSRKICQPICPSHRDACRQLPSRKTVLGFNLFISNGAWKTAIPCTKRRHDYSWVELFARRDLKVTLELRWL